MGFQDVSVLSSRASYSTTFPENCVRAECLGSSTFLRTIFGIGNGMLNLEYICSNKSFLMCQLNFMKTIRLSQSLVNLATLTFMDIAGFKTVVSVCHIW